MLETPMQTIRNLKSTDIKQVHDYMARILSVDADGASGRLIQEAHSRLLCVLNHSRTPFVLSLSK